MTITKASVDLPDKERRETACQMVVDGLESIRNGILIYDELGLTDKDLFEDLQKRGYEKSYRTLRKHTTALRKEGLMDKSSMARNRLRPKPATNPEPVENSTEKISPVHTTQRTHVVTDEEFKAFQDAVEAVQEWQAMATRLAAENERLQQELSTLTNDINPVQQHASRPADHGFGEGSELDEGIAPPIDYDWHPGIQVGSQEREDANRIGRLLDEIGRIQVKYAFTGIWGPKEWESILGGMQGLAACASAQRRFRPRSQSGPVIDIG